MSQHHTSKRILTPGRNVWKTARPDESGVLVDAADYYRAFYQAARQAKKTILLSGWQFDSGVQILRGQDAPVGAEVRLLKFLNELCEQNQDLEIYILAWDFHMVFALEREWMQSLYFHWTTNKRLHFRFDGAQAAQGSHHQKFAVIDRAVSFLGGIDLCEARWDDRRHRDENHLRLSHGEPSKPYHDTQAYFTGCDVADVLRELFVDRWGRSEGAPVSLTECQAPERTEYRPRGALPLSADEVSFSRTDPRAPGDTVREVESVFVDAIRAAEQLIYIETQYFSSRAIRDAFVERMRARDRPRLQIVVVLNEKPEAMKEEIAVGLRQAKTLQILATTAVETGHALGIYDSLSEGETRGRPSTYIHSKLLLVDDRFLTVGSANLTNRSMGVDTELHASWETDAGPTASRQLTERIKNLRVSLLAEHSGVVDGTGIDLANPHLSRDLAANPATDLAKVDGLVARLDALTRIKNARLKMHVRASEREKQVMGIVDPEQLPFDPAQPQYNDAAVRAAESDGHKEEEVEEERQARPLFVGGVTALWEKLKRG